jgi:carbon monoxide dehydrogenase subunit G
MQFEGEFRVPGRADDVLDRFTEVERMVGCMPGASIEGRADDGQYLGAMVVAFGPKKIKFRGKVAQEVDRAARTGRLHVHGAADMRAARVEVRVIYSVRDDPAAVTPTSIVSLTSNAEMGGVLAEFARTGGIAATRTLMESFAGRLAGEFGNAQRATVAGEVKDTTAPHVQPQVPPSITSIIWPVLKERLRALAARLRVLFQRTLRKL